MDRSTATRRAIYGRLAGDSTLKALLGGRSADRSIFHSQAPEFSEYPIVIINKQTGDPTDAFGPVGHAEIFQADVWMIKAVDHNTTADVAEAIRERVVTLLTDPFQDIPELPGPPDTKMSISGQTLVYLRRTSDVEYPEVLQGEMYRHVGSSFRLITSPT